MTVGRKSLLVLIAALLAVAMIGTGCSSGGGDTSGGDGGGTVVKIGIGAPLTQGAVALGQGMKRGAELAITEANESDKAKELGITFEAVSGDDQGDPKTGVTVANTFASDAALIGVMGHLNSGVSIPASAVYEDNMITMVSPASTNPELTKQGFAFVNRVCATDEVQGPVAADFAFNELGFKTAFVVDDSTPYGEGLASEFAKQFEANGGEVLGTEKTSDKDTDFNALVTKIKGEAPDVIYYGGIYNAGALLAKQASEAGVEAAFMSGDGMYDPEFINLAGAEAAEGAFCTSIGLPVAELPKAQDFTAAYAEAFPGEEIAAYDGYSFDAANAIIEAVLKVAEEQGVDALSSPDGKTAVAEAVRATQLDGVTGEVSFDENGDTNNKVITLYEVKDGEWTPRANNADTATQ